MALQEILLAGCPTVGIRTGASLIEADGTGLWVDRLPPGRTCVESDEDEIALAAYLDAIHQAQSFDRAEVRCRAAGQFASGRIVESLLAKLAQLRGVAAAEQPPDRSWPRLSGLAQ
jgi:hypothetical protein